MFRKSRPVAVCHNRPLPRRTPSGFTLIELLVVITIIGMLMAMLLPAVQAVRIAMQKVTCKSNLRQLGIAATNFKSASEQGFYPSGGWGYNWTGDPESNHSYGKKQPGGWTFTLLPYLDMSDVFDEGKDKPAAAKKTIAAKHIQQPMAIYLCPSRRDATRAYPVSSTPINSDPITLAARTDFAINAGDQPICQFDGGPTSFTDGDNVRWWNSGADPKVTKSPKYDTSTFTGVSYIGSEIATLSDGEQYTYLIAEKFMDTTKYLTGDDPGDTHALFSGFSNDSYRTGAMRPLKDRVRTSADVSYCGWGGPHDEYFHVVMCDTTTRPISYDIDTTVHKNLSNRKDGNNPSDSDF